MKNSKHGCLALACAVAFVLSGCATPVSPKPWYVGPYEGSFGDGETLVSFSVHCSVDRDCEVLMRDHKEAKTSRFASSKPAEFFPIKIPNNSFLSAREAVAKRPSLYDKRYESSLLRPLRFVLSGNGQLSQCLSIETQWGTHAFMCEYQDAQAKVSVPLLFTSSMKNNCGLDAFCAFYFIPLKRTSEK